MSAPAPGQKDLIEAFWLDYQRTCNIAVAGFAASALGHSRAVADELAELIVTGIKRAHTTLEHDFTADNDSLPQPGDHLVVLDGRGRPRAIVRNHHVERRHFDEIDDAFAFEAGEGDLTLRWWLTAHRQEFAERAEREGFQVGERVVLILEYFERVWPAEVAAPAA